MPPHARAKPLVSVVIAVHNGEQFLGPCIESVLGQDYRPIECVVVDDASTDGTPRVVATFGDAVRYVRQERGGVASARNLGISTAAADLVAFLDADDVWLPEKLTRQVELLTERPEVGLVYTGYLVVDEDLRPRWTVRGREGRDQIVRWVTLDGWGIGFPQTGLVRREVFECLGGFDERLSTSADLEFCWRVLQSFDVSAVPEPLALYRSHGAQMHRDFRVMARDLQTLYSEIFDDSSPAERSARRRATANLHVRVAFGHLRARQFQPAVSSLADALRTRPDRVLAAPLEASWRRLRRRRWRRRAPIRPATYTAADGGPPRTHRCGLGIT